MPQISYSEWEHFLSHHCDIHILQSPHWSTLKSNYGWDVKWVVCGNLGAQILLRALPLGVKVAYIAKGPIGLDIAKGKEDNPISNDQWQYTFQNDQWINFWQDIDMICKEIEVSFLILEPDIREITPDDQFCPDGFIKGGRSIQPSRTIVVDISQAEEDILSRMKQKTRYNIRLAQKKGVTVNFTDDTDLVYGILSESAKRDKFTLHHKSYYQNAYQIFHSNNQCGILISEHDNQPLSVIMIFIQGTRSWYFYGGSSNIKREYMPSYLIQWEAIRWAKSRGCKSYDLWGVPDFSEDELEKSFIKYSKDLWGVYRFKRGFGGDLYRWVGPWVRVYQPAAWKLYRIWTYLQKII